MQRRILSCSMVVLLACGGAEAPSQPAPTPAAPAAAANPTPASTMAEAAPAPTEAEAEAAPLDLLHAIPTHVAVSSVYQDDESQLAKLVDGDLATAWNSRTGDLVGAWIDVRVPEGATVTSIAMTAGFSHARSRTDLFLGNHRVARVRVLHDGTELGVFPLDTHSRALQTLPVQGGPGVYGIEVAEVAVGTHDTWHETCISELRVMGRAPGAQAGSQTPQLQVGRPLGAAHTPPSATAEAVAAAPTDDAPAEAGNEAPDLERAIRELLVANYGEEVVSHADISALGTVDGSTGRSVAFKVRAQDETGILETLMLVVGVQEAGELVFFGFELGEARSEPGAEGTAVLDSFTGFQLVHGVLRAELGVTEGYAEFATCATCQQRSQEATTRKWLSLICATVDEEAQCWLVPSGLTLVSQGVDIDDRGHRAPRVEDGAPEDYRLRITLVDANHAHIELGSGHAAESTDALVGDKTLLSLTALGVEGTRLEALD